ncbi:MAG: M28 family peptidase [Muribaculaceae bacterium]|nr:M28 family peptidase [Muribaculaceae bacterium]
MRMIYAIVGLAMMVAACGNGNNATTSSNENNNAAKTIDVQFNADSAYNYVKQQCDMGPRVPGTPAHEQCAQWLTGQLRRWCDTVIVQQAPVVTFDGTALNCKNIVGTFNPAATDRVLLLAHWDCRPWADNDPDEALRSQPVMGANDAASGVAVLLEMARLMASQRPEVGVDLLMVDVEDWGQNENEDSWALGTQHWANNPHVPGYRANCGILLDMVGTRNARFTQEYFSKQYAQGVVDMVWNAASQAGYGSFFVKQPGGAITDDHVMVNRLAGIPCIDIIDMRPESDTGFFEAWHTTHDTLDKIDPASLQAVGQTLLQVIFNW